MRDIEGEHIYLYTNTTCLYRRDGSRLPYGSGKLSGIVVHELFPRFEWEDNASGDDESYGYIGRYQLRHVSKSDFDGLAEDFEESFSALLTEYRFLQYDNNKVYPTYGTNGYLTHSYQGRHRSDQDSRQRGFQLPRPRGQQVLVHLRVEHRQRQRHGHHPRRRDRLVRDNPDVNSNTIGRHVRRRQGQGSAQEQRRRPAMGSIGTGGTRPTTADTRGS